MRDRIGRENISLSVAERRLTPFPADVWAYALALLPVLGMVWSSPVFVTQDGPAHLYNAQILRWCVEGREAGLGEYYSVRYEPLPNWAGHALLVGLLKQGLEPLSADRLVVSLTLAGVGAAVLALRRICAPGPPSAGAGLLCGLLSMNMAWLLGFSSFLIGFMLGLITICLAWRWRERREAWRILVLSGLLVVGYFCHLVSLGLTCVTIVWLTLRGGKAAWRERVWRLGLLLLPLVPLGVWHSVRMTGAGGLAPRWLMLAQGNLFRRLFSQLTWVDPLTLGQKSRVPILGWQGAIGYVVSPVMLLGAAGLLYAVNGWYHERSVSRRMGWADWFRLPLVGRTGMLFLLGSVACPDTLAPAHGNYLPQRVALWGLALAVAGLPAVRLGRVSRQVVGGLLLLAWGMQVLTLLEYARWCEREVGPFLALRTEVAPRERIGTLLIDVKSPFRANPLLHADNLLGVETPCVIWNNYEARHYYFPVTFRAAVGHPDPFQIERINLMGDLADQSRRVDLWRQWLRDHHALTDTLVVRGENPALDGVTREFYEPALRNDRITLWRRPLTK